MRITIALVLLAAAPAAAAEPSSPSPRLLALAEQVLAASGNDARVAAAQRGGGTRLLLTEALRKALPGVAPDSPVIAAVVQEELRDEAEQLYQENRSIYAALFSEAELGDMLRFYQSPGGRALVAHTPAIVAEKMAFGQRLGREAMERMAKSVCARTKC